MKQKLNVFNRFKTPPKWKEDAMNIMNFKEKVFYKKRYVAIISAAFAVVFVTVGSILLLNSLSQNVQRDEKLKETSKANTDKEISSWDSSNEKSSNETLNGIVDESIKSDNNKDSLTDNENSEAAISGIGKIISITETEMTLSADDVYAWDYKESSVVFGISNAEVYDSNNNKITKNDLKVGDVVLAAYIGDVSNVWKIQILRAENSNSTYNNTEVAISGIGKITSVTETEMTLSADDVYAWDYKESSVVFGIRNAEVYDSNNNKITKNDLKVGDVVLAAYIDDVSNVWKIQILRAENSNSTYNNTEVAISGIGKITSVTETEMTLSADDVYAWDYKESRVVFGISNAEVYDSNNNKITKNDLKVGDVVLVAYTDDVSNVWRISVLENLTPSVWAFRESYQTGSGSKIYNRYCSQLLNMISNLSENDVINNSEITDNFSGEFTVHLENEDGNGNVVSTFIVFNYINDNYYVMLNRKGDCVFYKVTESRYNDMLTTARAIYQ